MDTVLTDLKTAFGAAANADMLYVLLPMAIIAIAQGLRAGGIGDLIEKAGSGLIYVGIANLLMRAGMSGAPLQAGTWSAQLEQSWNTLMDFHFMEVLGFWLLLLAGIALIFTVRSVLRK